MKNTIKVEEIFLLSSLAFLVFALLIRKKTTGAEMIPTSVVLAPKSEASQVTPPKSEASQVTPSMGPEEVKAATARPWQYDVYD